ncbi:MAG: DUF4845 domain-containing protein [Gammaproteobacteria bacterium]
MRQRQRGITAIGFLLIAALVGMIGYGAIRLLPVYMTQFKIRQMLSALKTEYEDNKATQSGLQAEIGKRLDIEGVDYPTRKDFTVAKSENGFTVGISYEDSVPYIANLYLLARFDNTVEIRQ